MTSWMSAIFAYDVVGAVKRYALDLLPDAEYHPMMMPRARWEETFVAPIRSGAVMCVFGSFGLGLANAQPARNRDRYCWIAAPMEKLEL